MTGISMETIISMLHPGLVLIVCGIITMLVPRSLLKPMTIISPILSAASIYFLSEESSLKYVLGSNTSLDFIHADSIAIVFLIGICVIAFLGNIFGISSQSKIEAGISMIYAGGVMGIVAAGDLISITIFLVISVLSSAYLIYSGNTDSSTDTAARHIFIQIIACLLILTGALAYIFHYGNDLSYFDDANGTYSFWLIAAGIAILAAVPPLHSWFTNACAVASQSGAVFISSFSPIVSIYLIIRLFAGNEMLVWAGGVMIVYCAIRAVMENDIRKLISYNIIAQTGISAISIGMGGEQGINSAISHIIMTCISMCVLMMCAGVVYNYTGSGKVTEHGRLASKMPIVTISFFVASLAIAINPDISGIVNFEFSLDSMRTNISSDLFIELIILTAIICSLISITMKTGYFVFFRKPVNTENLQKPENIETSKSNRKAPVTTTLAIIIGVAVIIFIVISPEFLTGLLPFKTGTLLFGMEELIKGISILLGVLISFFVFIKLIKPSDEIILDFDWITRKPIKQFIMWLSGLSARIFDR